MSINFFIDGNPPCLLQPWSQNKQIDIVITGSKQSFYSSEIGFLLLQEYRNADFSLGYITVRFLKKTKIGLEKILTGMKFQAALKNDLSILEAGVKHILKSGHFRLSEDREKIEEMIISRDNDHRLLYITFSPEMLKKLGIKESDLAMNTKGVIREEMSDTILNLFNAPYRTEFLPFYYENKVRELLFEAMISGGKIKAGNGLTLKETEAIYAIDSIIGTNIVEHHTIDQLSKQSGLSLYKLKKGFRELFGTGLFERLLERRIEHAKKLLAETDKPIKEIAALIGYARLTSFITAFKKRTKKTPREYRTDKGT